MERARTNHVKALWSTRTLRRQHRATWATRSRVLVRRAIAADTYGGHSSDNLSN